MSIRKREIYSLQDDLSEREFLEREFNLIFTKITDANLSDLLTRDTYLLATSKIKDVEKLISKSKDHSVVLFFFGNETYNVDEFNYLNKYAHKIKKSYFQMLPRRTRFSVFFKTIPFAIYDGALKFNHGSNFFRHLKNGFDLMRRTKRIDTLFPVEYFPMGYTNRFITELKMKFPEMKSQSVINFNMNSKIPKTELISFVGQEGNWNRKFAIHILRNSKINSMIKIKAGWGGMSQENETVYLDSLLRSKYILCPPGNISNLCFRYLEALICGALPLTPPASIQDPHLWNNWTQFSKLNLYSWKNLIKFATKIENTERIRICSLELTNEINLINQINQEISDILV